MAGLLKAILVLRNQAVPPQIRYLEPKSGLDLEARNIHIPKSTVQLPPGPHRASVNSFGYGGTNCHVIIESLESYCDRTTHQSHITHSPLFSERTSEQEASEIDDLHPELLVLSANSEKSLRLSAQRLQTWISKQTDTTAEYFADFAHSLLHRRSRFPWRQSIAASDLQEVHRALEHLRPVKSTQQSRVVYIFTGQGAQWAGMGRELLDFPIFKESLLKSESLLQRAGCQWTLSQEVLLDNSKSRLGRAEIAQPATTALQIALVDLLKSLNVLPFGVVGHSSGEIAAAYAAGALSHEAAIEA